MAAGGNRNIQIVEDDKEFRQTLAEQLRLHEEFDVEETGTGADAVAGAEKNDYSAMTAEKTSA